MRLCTAAHTAAADLLLDDASVAEKVKHDLIHAPVSDKMKALLTIAKAVQQNGRLVTPAMTEEAKLHGATDMELHDTVLIATLFSLYNRYVDGLASVTPSEPAFYNRLAHIFKEKGYMPSENRYAGL